MESLLWGTLKFPVDEGKMQLNLGVRVLDELIHLCVSVTFILIIQLLLFYIRHKFISRSMKSIYYKKQQRLDEIIKGKEYNASNNRCTSCIICLNDLVRNKPESLMIKEIVQRESIVATLECLHSFHYDCICSWMVYQNKCPMCRDLIDKKEPNYKFFRMDDDEDNDYWM
jgi:hypothetical protein